jgi:AcrR family transcriptional regulator
MNGPRKPKQQRSILKKKEIIKAGLKLFSTKGYYNTNTAEIAKEAKVSTGIVYRYFKDKKDIFMHAISLYLDQMYVPIIKKLDTMKYPIDIECLLNDIIEITIDSHTILKSIHEEMMAMSHLDEDINKCFHDINTKMVEFWISFLKKNHINSTNIYEKLFISINLIENFCHEFVYHKQETINYQTMKEEIIRIILNLLL